MVKRAYPEEFFEVVKTDGNDAKEIYVTKDEFEKFVNELRREIRSTQSSKKTRGELGIIEYGLAFAVALLIFFLILYLMKLHNENR